jgi:hypothetical protein
LNEECGLSRSDIEFVKNDEQFAPDELMFVDEMTPRNTLSCRYYVATMKKEKLLKPENEKEVLSFGYYQISDAMKLLKPQRQEVLKQVIKKITQLE